MPGFIHLISDDFIANSSKLSPLLDTPTAGEYIGFSRYALEAWRVKGVGPTYVKIGTRVRYRQSDLDAFLQSAAVHTDGNPIADAA